MLYGVEMHLHLLNQIRSQKYRRVWQKSWMKIILHQQPVFIKRGTYYGVPMEFNLEYGGMIVKQKVV